MRVVVCKELGPLDNVVVEERATPVPGPGHVVVDVRAAGVNYVDGLICQGRYQMKPAVPYVPGGEIAGVVSAVGDGVTRVQVGERVMAMTGFGAFAEQVVVSEVVARRRARRAHASARPPRSSRATARRGSRWHAAPP